jgi:hypothetical protein
LGTQAFGTQNLGMQDLGTHPTQMLDAALSFDSTVMENFPAENTAGGH